MQLSRYWIIYLSAAVVAASYAFAPSYPELRDEVGYMLRVTARLAFGLLLLAYIARPLVRTVGWGRGLLRQRRYLGLSVALVHTVHFGYVASLYVLLGEPVEWFVIIFGGMAFVLMWLMAATSNDWSIRRLGKNWRRLHLTGMHYLWIVFMQSFAGRIGPGDEYNLYACLFGAGVLAAMLRAVAYWQQCQRTTRMA